MSRQLKDSARIERLQFENTAVLLELSELFW